MSLTVCCQWLESRQKRDGSIVYENSIKEKSLQLGAYKNGKYSDSLINSIYHNNLDEISNVIPKLVYNNIRSFRLSSGLLPLFEFCSDIAKNDDSLIVKLQQIGNKFKENNIRVSCHPGQFAVISSDSDDVIKNTIKELEYHAWIFDQMGFAETPHYAINIHGGKRGNWEKAINTISNMPNNVKNRLTLENDESCYSVRELLKVHEKTTIPIVWDSHHHTFNEDNMTLEEACAETFKTWTNAKPLQHLSNTEPQLINGSFTDRRKHSFYVHYVPNCQKTLINENMIDLDVEAKGKNLAVLKMRRDFDIND